MQDALTRESAEGAIVCHMAPHVRVPKARSYVTSQSLHDRAGTLASIYIAQNLTRFNFDERAYTN